MVKYSIGESFVSKCDNKVYKIIRIIPNLYRKTFHYELAYIDGDKSSSITVETKELECYFKSFAK